MKAFLVVLGTHTLSLSILHPSHPQPSHSHLHPHTPSPHTPSPSHTLTHQPDNYEAQMVELHKAKAGNTPAQAESEFLQVAKELPRYGMHLFAAQVSN